MEKIVVSPLLDTTNEMASTYLGLARIAEAEGDVRQATLMYAKALARQPDLREARDALVRSRKPAAP